MRLILCLLCLFIAGLAFQVMSPSFLGLEGWGAVGTKLHSFWSWTVVLNAVPLLLAGFSFSRPEGVRWIALGWAAWLGILSSGLLMGWAGVPSPPSFRGTMFIAFVWLFSLATVVAAASGRRSRVTGK